MDASSLGDVASRMKQSSTFTRRSFLPRLVKHDGKTTKLQCVMSTMMMATTSSCIKRGDIPVGVVIENHPCHLLVVTLLQLAPDHGNVGRAVFENVLGHMPDMTHMGDQRNRHNRAFSCSIGKWQWMNNDENFHIMERGHTWITCLSCITSRLSKQAVVERPCSTRVPC